MNSNCKSIFLLGLVCLISSCDFSDSFIEKEKELTANDKQYIDDEIPEEYVVNTERLDSISQNLNLLEHRVYYVDCSGSMISSKSGNKDKNGRTLLDKVKDSLEVSLLNLDTDSVDIDVIPFYGRKWNNGVLQASTINKRGKFSLKDRKKIHEIISSISIPENSNSWNTHHSIPINDFLNNRISNKKQYHVMILLTDGKDEYNMGDAHELSGIDALKNNWIKSCEQNKIYGIYVNLPTRIIEDGLPDYFKNNGSNKLFWIEGVNFNINIFQLGNTIEEVLLRKDSLIRIPFGGKLPKGIELTPKEDKYYKYELYHPHKDEKYLKIKVSAIHDGKLPDSLSTTLHFVYNWDDHKTNTYNFPDKETVAVTIVDEKTPKLELCEANTNLKKGSLIKRHLSYYKKWHGIGKEYSDTITLSLSYSYSKDVTDDSSIEPGYIKIEGLPKEYVRILDSLGHDITNHNILLSKSQSGKLDFKLTLIPGSPSLKGDKIDSAKIRFIGFDNYNTIKWNGKRICKTNDGTYIVNAVNLTVSENLNPIEKYIRWFLILLLFSLCLFWIAIMSVRASLDKFTNDSPALQFKTDPEINQPCLNIDPSTPLTGCFNYFNSYVITNIIIKYSDADGDKGKIQLISWGLGNFWNLRLAFSGDRLLVLVHEDPNCKFFDEIKLTPLKEGIRLQVQVKNQRKKPIELIEREHYKDLDCEIKDRNMQSIKLEAKIYPNSSTLIYG